MNILHVIPGFELEGGGGNRACAELAEGQAALGHSVTVVHVKKKHPAATWNPDGVTVVGIQGHIFTKYRFSLMLPIQLASYIRKSDIVHIHSTWLFPNIPAAMLSKAMGVPYIVQPHGNLEPWKLSYKRYRKKAYNLLIEQHILKGAASIMVESRKDQNDIQRYNSSLKTFTLPCGAWADAFKRIRPPIRRIPYVLYLARLDVNKGIIDLIRAFKQIFSETDMRLVVAGPGYSEVIVQAKKAAEEMGILNLVDFTGMVSEDDKISLLQNAFCYILPSYSENFGISVLEALFCQTPVITTTSTPWIEFLENNVDAIIIPPGEKHVAQALSRMRDLNDDARNRMATGGYQKAIQSFDWKSISQQTISHYQRIIEEHPK